MRYIKFLFFIFLSLFVYGETSIKISAVPAKANVLHDRIDNFDNDNKKTDQQLVPDGAWWDIYGGSTYTYFVVSTMSFSGSSSLEVNYIKYSDPYTYFMCGDLTKPFNNHDFTVSATSSISMYVYPVNKKVRILLKFRDSSGTETNDIGINETTSFNSWEKLIWYWDSTKVGGCDMKNVKEILFFVEPGSTSVSGKFYIDDVFLEDVVK